MTSQGEAFVCTSSGGPWLKEEGRVGSSAIRGAGFDIDTIGDTEIAICLASGHGENIIDRQTCSVALRKLKRKGFAPSEAKLM